MKVTFIPDEQSGIVLKSFINVLHGLNTVRARAVNIRRISQSLRLLGAITSEPVTFISEGINSAGRIGLFIGQEGEGSTGFGGTQDGQTGT